MKKQMTWKNNNEKNAYDSLKKILPDIEQLGLQDTHCALRLLLRRRENKNEWNWDVFEDFVNLFTNEICLQDETYRSGMKILNTILSNTYRVKKKKGKLIDLFAIKQTQEQIDNLEKSLG